MKQLIANVAMVALLVQPGFAGGMTEPIMEPEVIVEDSSSSGGFLIPLLLLAIVVAVASSDSGETVGNGNVISDMRLKDDIVRVGTAANGLALYRFSYRGLPGMYEGVMAQDVLRHTPSAVTTLPGGYMGVDYDALGLEMRRIR